MKLSTKKINLQFGEKKILISAKVYLKKNTFLSQVHPGVDFFDQMPKLKA